MDRCTRKSYGLLLGYINLLSSDARTIRKLILVENEKDHGQLIKYIGASYVFSEDLMDTTFFQKCCKEAVFKFTTLIRSE